MNRNRQLITAEEAKPANGQHENPCSDCPWSRKALPGWLGELSRDEWLLAAHGEDRIECHTLIPAQCAGAARYRANVCKTPRDSNLLVLPPDRERVFATPAEFREHHDMHRVSERIKAKGGGER